MRGLRNFLLSGRGAVDAIARRLSRRYGNHAGLGISVYAGGKELASRVCLQTRDVSALARLLKAIRAQLPPKRDGLYILLSQLGFPEPLSVAAYRARGLSLGRESVAVRRRASTVVLAHVPCFMGWSDRMVEEVLARKCGRTRFLEVSVFPTLTEWLDDDRPQLTCRGGLRVRPGALGGETRLRVEVRLVTHYLRGQLSDRDIAYSYDAWRDRVVSMDSVGRKAIALGALRKGARLLGDDSIVRGAESALAHLAQKRRPVGDIHDAHLLLASTPIEDPVRFERIRRCLRPSGALVGYHAADQEYFPGVAITALASRGALSKSECARTLRYYRARFWREPTWPALWWQLRAWGTVGVTFPAVSHDFITELADWALTHQLPSGAFDTWVWRVAPSFLTVCVAEGLLAAARALRRYDRTPTADRCIDAARRALRFTRSLVLDERHSSLFPRPARALGGVRDWHGGLVLRADTAGHYLTALTELAALT